MNGHFNFLREENSRELFATEAISRPAVPQMAKLRGAPIENSGKNRLRELRGWDFRDRHQVAFPETKQNLAPQEPVGVRMDPVAPKRTSLLGQPEVQSIPTNDTERATKLSHENSMLKRENEYLKRHFKTAKADLKKAQEKINELENAITELRAQLNARESPLENSAEEVKEEVPMEDLAEIAKRFNYDPTNADELKSLELALKLEAEERQIMERELLMQQNEALRALDNSARGINPDFMSYEQLLELEEKIGSVSKGLPKEIIDVFSPY